MNRTGTGIALAAAILLAGPAIACPPPPPPPVPPKLSPAASAADQTASDTAWNEAHYRLQSEQARSWSLKQQARLFDEAKAIAVARYDRASKVSGMPKQFAFMNGDPLSIVKPVRWVKGTGSMDELTLGRGEAPMCGQIAAHDAFYGKPGEVFLIYLGDDGRVVEGFALERMIEPRTLAALTAPAQ